MTISIPGDGDDAPSGRAQSGSAPTGLAALTAPSVTGITRLAAIDTVRARLALAVDLGLLLPGERVPPVEDVADALAVSPITARRALESLAEEGVLVRRRGRGGGTFVADVPAHSAVAEIRSYLADAAEVHELIDRRVLLECAIAHHAALAATDADLAALDLQIARMRTAASWTEYHLADESFHVGIATASGLDFALPLYRAALAALYRYFLPYPIAFLHGVNDDHADLVAALRRSDPVDAVRIARAHVEALHHTMFVGLPQPPNAAPTAVTTTPPSRHPDPLPDAAPHSDG
ncbi:FCD domain-containing protein [Cryobacterium breve]|uniref:FCD domain-containing protein n=1 Tax=Cryobacterium breve TaxID=1259258 RepID=UPI00248C7A36|nr:FCD domain-containing protein [Cryobacterium breve]